ncbi:MAG: MFS transporter, partial [Treponemataceae bacterium]|nr:MFS transporter [Treponemataceae bacterium]
SDMTYEAARSINGSFLRLLGTSATTVGLVAGAGELIGYGLRFVSGYFSDKTRRYWLITGIGYAINLLSVPLLAVAGRWEVAALLMILERAGRAIRNPARDAMLSHATSEVGHGKGFGVHEALDQIGATTGPLIISAALVAGASMRHAFAWLLLPAIAALSILAFTRLRFPRPQTLEVAEKESLSGKGLPRSYWVYLIAASLVAAGFVDYPLLAFHFQKVEKMQGSLIALYYAIAMGVDAGAALLFGVLYDKIGMKSLVIATALSCLFPLFAFSSTIGGALVGVVLWGIGMGAQESIMRAAIAHFSSKDKRATAYGLFNMVYGIAWFLGRSLFGILYGWFLPGAIVFSLLSQIVAIPLFVLSSRVR